MTSSPPRLTPSPTPRGGLLLLAAQLVVYNLALFALLPAAAAWLLWRTLVQRRPIGSWRHRVGLVPRLPKGNLRVWLHAVSAGEMAAARPVLEALRHSMPAARIGVSTITPAGMAMAQKNSQAADALFYLPFDTPAPMVRALLRLRPQLVVVTEKELWPNFLGFARLLGARVLIVNGRVSDRMVSRARWAPGFVRWLYRLPDHICVQSREDARRLAMLGAGTGRVTIAGNTKVDSMAGRDRESERKLAEDLGVAEGDVWLVAGSTHPGEEEVVVEAFDTIRRGIPSVRLLLAPRHLERVASVSAMVAQRGLSVVRRSEGSPPPPDAIVVLDTMGELGAAYSFATAGFVGGTLAPIGGHNLLEPVAVGRAVLFGPHTENCADAAEMVLTDEVGFRVNTADELAERFVWIARDAGVQSEIAARGWALIDSQRGAAKRSAMVARRLLDERDG